MARDGDGPVTGRLSRRLGLGLGLCGLVGGAFFLAGWALSGLLAWLPGMRIPWLGGPLVFLAYAVLLMCLWHRWLLAYGCDLPARLLRVGRLLAGALVRLGGAIRARVAAGRAGTKPKTDPPL
jgi:hypothetical protein